MSSPATMPVLFTVEDLNRMIGAGVFVGRPDRIELIEGVLRMMSPATEEHDDVIQYLIDWSQHVASGRYRIGSQRGIRLLKSESMPEPDVFWIDAAHRRGRPTSKVIPLVIEVAVTSMDHDLVTKQRLYAIEQIAEYWVVAPDTETVIVHREPVGERYGKVETICIGQSVSPICIPEASLDLNWLFRE